MFVGTPLGIGGSSDPGFAMLAVNTVTQQCGRQYIAGRDVMWARVVQALSGSASLRPIQVRALEMGLLHSRKHFVVSAPTNAGKSLVGLIGLLQAVAAGRRDLPAGKPRGPPGAAPHTRRD